MYQSILLIITTVSVIVIKNDVFGVLTKRDAVLRYESYFKSDSRVILKDREMIV